MFFRFCSIVFLTIICASCVTKPDRMVLERTSFSNMIGWQQGNQHEAVEALLRSCKKNLLKDKKQPLNKNKSLSENEFGTNSFGKIEDWQTLCDALGMIEKSDKDALRILLEKELTPFHVTNNGKKTGMFTGYYEPQLRGSLRKHGAYRYPLYKKPSDLTGNTPYLNRKKINSGALDKRSLEIVYLDDPIERFFLHIQGSGRIKLDNGELLRIGYAAKNSHKYFSIGKYLLEENEIAREDMSADAIKEWLRSHPSRARKVMEMNPSYIFFRQLKNKIGPIGAQGVPLTPQRSLAVDSRFIPYGVPIWLETTLPSYNETKRSFNQLMVSQDTGSAIKGPVRGDVFFGYGKEAELLASHMQQRGRYIVLLPKQRHLVEK